MSEPTRTSAAQRIKLATALKRNMARRKGVVRVESRESSETSATPSIGHRVAFHGEPLAAGGQRSVGDKESASIKDTAS